MTLVVQLLASCHADVQLRAATPQPHAQGDERHALALDLLRELLDLSPVCQELAGAVRVMVRIGAMGVRADVCADQPQLTVGDAHVRLTDGNLALANRLDLRSGQHDSCLERVAYRIVMECAPVLGHDPVSTGSILTRGASLLRHAAKYTGTTERLTNTRTPPPSASDHPSHQGDSPNRADPYDDIAELYDIEHEGFDDDVALMRNIASIVGDPIIEFGCGTGRILLPIAADGHAVTGVDTSVEMLRRLQERARELDGGSVNVVQADMRTELPLPADTFGVGIFSLNGLMHLETQEEQVDALREAARVLDPRGQLVVDLFNPTPEYLTQLTSGPQLEGVWTTVEGEVEKWSHRTLRPAAQALDTRIWYDRVDEHGSLRRVRTSFTLRYIHAAELELMLEKAGFVEWQLYGSYDLDPFEDTSERLIALAELTPS